MTRKSATFSTTSSVRGCEMICEGRWSKGARHNPAVKDIGNDFTGNFCMVHINAFMYLYFFREVLQKLFCKRAYIIITVLIQLYLYNNFREISHPNLKFFSMISRWTMMSFVSMNWSLVSLTVFNYWQNHCKLLSSKMFWNICFLTFQMFDRVLKCCEQCVSIYL